jgi:D-glycero-alpha-D-manno-heptose-7-phosphate kinase
VIEATVPVRICDHGGWTDTWFGGPGRILNLAVRPGVDIRVARSSGPARVFLDVVNTGDRYAITPGETRAARYPLLEAAIDAAPPPADLPLEIGVRSAVPIGCGAGTSAAAAVALLGALAAVCADHESPRDLAYAAHHLEVDVLGLESGIQDQLSAAFGGINYIEIDPYPHASVRTLPQWDELSARITLLFLGRAHDSSHVHRQVIEHVHGHGSSAFARLRDAAEAARDAVLAQDLAAFGRAMTANTDAQRGLHPALVGADARRAIGVAAACGALGWKVNGAGGDGGSMTILSQSATHKAELDARAKALDDRYQVLPCEVSSAGVEVRGALD